MYKGAIFDLDDTLYEYEGINKIAIEQLCDYTCSLLNIQRETFYQAFELARTETKDGMSVCASQHNRMIYCQKTLEHLGINPILYALEMYETYWGSMLSHMRLNPGVIKLFSELKNAGFMIAICTDLTTHIQHRKIRKLGIDQYIDVLVTSEEAGAEKPDPKIFRLCLNKMKLNVDQVFFVGDSLKKDIYGANQMNIKPIWYNPSRKVREENNIKYEEIHTMEQMIDKEFFIWE